MRKTILIAAVSVFLFTASHNQASAQFGVQAGVFMPQGDWGDIWETGFGGQIYYKMDKGDGMKIGGSVGYFSAPGGDLDLGGLGSVSFPDATVIPLLGTFDYAMGDSFYVGGDAGYNVISFSGGSGVTAAGSSAALIPKVGVNFGGLNAEARFNVIGDSYLGILIGYSFGGN